MLIFTADRDIILKTQPLFVAPNIRISRLNGRLYIVSAYLYHGSVLLGSYDTDAEALAEMDAINNSTEEVYFVGGYHGRDIGLVEKLNAELRRYLMECD
jgi:hypothetical protein